MKSMNSEGECLEMAGRIARLSSNLFDRGDGLGVYAMIADSDSPDDFDYKVVGPTTTEVAALALMHLLKILSANGADMSDVIEVVEAAFDDYDDPDRPPPNLRLV